MPELPRLVRRRSPISGWGGYAAQPIEEDRRIVEYKGQLVSQPEGWRRECRYLPRHRIWIFNINGRVTEIVRYGRGYTYALTPKRSGKLQIPGPLAEVGGRELRGPPRTLEVIAPAEQELAL